MDECAEDNGGCNHALCTNVAGSSSCGDCEAGCVGIHCDQDKQLADCKGVPGGSTSLDACRVCGGDSTSCAVVCQNLWDPRYGSVHYTHVDDQSGVIRFPSTATYDCEHGHTSSGTTPRQCRLDGTWSGHDATCDAIVCESLSTLANGETFYSHHREYDSSVTFTCDQGYELEPFAEIDGAIKCGYTVTGSTVGARSVQGEEAGEHLFSTTSLSRLPGSTRFPSMRARLRSRRSCV